MRESGHKHLSERVHDIAEAGAIRFGKLWLDKDNRTLNWPDATNKEGVGPDEAEIIRLLMGVSHGNTSKGGIISTPEFQKWFDEVRISTDKTLTSNDQIARQVLRLNEKLKRLTGNAISIETEGQSRGSRGYFLKEHQKIDNEA